MRGALEAGPPRTALQSGRGVSKRRETRRAGPTYPKSAELRHTEGPRGQRFEGSVMGRHVVGPKGDRSIVLALHPKEGPASGTQAPLTRRGPLCCGFAASSSTPPRLGRPDRYGRSCAGSNAPSRTLSTRHTATNGALARVLTGRGAMRPARRHAAISRTMEPSQSTSSWTPRRLTRFSVQSPLGAWAPARDPCSTEITG
jgi:hypothetical protein